MRSVLLAVVAAAALGLPATSFSAARTTNPGLAPVALYVTLTDRGITYTMWQMIYEEGHHGLLVANSLQRGEVAFFYVHNTGKRPHAFTAFGKKTAALKHGAKARFKVALLHRGTFAYSSPSDKGRRGFSGTLKVY